MRERVAVPPPWLLAALQGVVFAAWMMAYTVIVDHDSLAHAARGSVIGGVFFAVGMGFVGRRQHARVRHVIGMMDSEQERDVERAAASGSAPGDPQLLPAAVALARDRLAQHLRFRTFSLVTFTVAAAFSVISAIADSRWYLLGAAGFAAAVVWTVRYPQQLNRRIAALEGHARPSA